MARKTDIMAVLAAAAIAGCGGEGSEGAGGEGLVGSTIFFPYPSMHLMVEDSSSATGHRVRIPAEIVPVAEGGALMKTERFDALDGFSPATPCLVHHEGWRIDPATLPGQGRIEESTAEDASVQIIDLETGERVPLMAELDGNDQAIGEDRRALIIRPMRAMRWAARHAVVVTRDVTDPSGEPIEQPRPFSALVAGDPPADLEPWADHYDDLFTRLEEIGFVMDEVALAWDFWTGSEDSIHARMDLIVARTTEDIPSDPAFVPDYELYGTRCLDSDLDPEVDPMIWRHVELSFSMATFVDGEGKFVLDAGGMPVEQGVGEFYLIVHVPPSVHDAAPGTVPVVVFGHGLLGLPQDYFPLEGDPLGNVALSDSLGMIFAAPEWRGLSYRDELDAVIAATDFGEFHRVTEDLHMGIANFLAVARMFEGGFADEPFLLASDGSGSLVDRDRIYYLGISLGGHEGGVAVALSDVFDFGVLQVGGAPWSTMLERSSNWADYETIMHPRVEDPVDRQMLYAVTQLFWDPVDPCTYHDDLRPKSVLLQESVGDAQVPNISTEFWARSLGIPLVGPSTRHPAFVEEVPAPQGPGASGLVIYDAMVHASCGEMPVEANVPAEDNCAHSIIRKTEAYAEQVEAFLADGTEGTIVHPPSCGADPCTPEP